MNRKLRIITLLFLPCLSGCSLFDEDYMDFARLPRNDTEGIAAATLAAAQTPDLDLDGDVNGWEEWEAFIRTWVQTYQASKK